MQTPVLPTCVVLLLILMNTANVSIQHVSVFKFLETNVTLESLDVTDAVNGSLVKTEASGVGKLPRTDITLMIACSRFSAIHAVAVRCVVVSFDC